MATPATPRAIDGEKAQRIVEAMRRSIAQRGVAAATFDHVAGEAGVSRGLLHYYFGTKEALLAEVVRRECDVRITQLESQLQEAESADAFVELLRTTLERMHAEDPDFVALLFELFTMARRNEELADGFREVLSRTREHVAAVLEAKNVEGVIEIHAPADAIVDVIFALGDGLALRMVSEPDRDFSASIAAATDAVRSLIASA
ncbi:TetR/AcrR family transcriptional regulator [Paraconexibacter sp.]|uniref:TetR/AcrR family transcriptional regulator n=1 Tax=Paraconexibacter sp. TaxID=2949640 RepID=UPI00356241FC